MARIGQKVISNHIFPEKLGQDRALNLSFLDSPTAQFVNRGVFSFLNFGVLHSEKRGQRWTKTKKKCTLWERPIAVKI